MAKSRIGASYWQVIPTIEGLEKAIEEEVGKATKDGYATPIDPVVDTGKLDDDMGAAGDRAGKGFGDKFSKAFAVAGALTAVGAIGAATGKALYDLGDQFDGLKDSIQIGTGASGKALGELEDVAKNIFTSIPTNTETAAKAVADLNTRLGLTGDDLELVSKQVIEAGRLLGEEVDVNALGGAFRQFSVQTDQMDESLDSVFRTSQDTGVGFNSLLSSVESNAAGLKTLGLGFNESVELIGQLDKAGLSADAVLAQMSKGIVNFAKDGQPAQEAIAGVVSQIDSLLAAGDKTAAIDLASQLFGTKGALNIVNSIESGIITADSFNASMENVGNTILGTAEDTNDFAEKWQILQNKGMEAIEPLATAVFDLAATILEKAGPALDVMLDIISNMAVFFAENEWAIGAVATVIGGALVGAFVSATVAAWGFLAPIIANPLILWVGLAVVAITALVAAFSWLIDNWDSVIAFFETTIHNLTNFFADIGIGVFNFFADIGRGIANFFIGIVNFVIDIVNNMIESINALISFIPNLLGANWSGPFSTISSLPQMAEGGTVLPTAGGTVVTLAEAGRAETVVDTGKMNSLIENILTGNLNVGEGSGAPVINLYITQKEEQSMKAFIEEIMKEIQFQLTGGEQYNYA